MHRRQMLTAAVAMAAVPQPGRASPPEKGSWGLCLNTSTIRGQKLTLPQIIDLAAAAGYGAIEPWAGEIDRFLKDGGKLAELNRRIHDRGLVVADIIGFPEWIVDDDARRARGLAEAKRVMELARHLECKTIAAPPIGAQDGRAEVIDINRVADRYFQLAEVGAKADVVPLVELWGFSKNLRTLAEAVYVAVRSGHPKAAVLPDVYHLHRGGSPLRGLHLLGPMSIGIFHVNDYPASKPREALVDADRVYPGDGAAPWREILADLKRIGYRGWLSLELFNPGYWQQDAALVARTGHEKLLAVIQGNV